MHVGLFLKEGYLKPSGMSQQDLANKLNTTTASLSRLFSGKASLSYQMAIELEKVWPRKAETWLLHQVRYELEQLGYKVN